METVATVAEVIAYLQTQPQDAKVFIKNSLWWEAMPLREARFVGAMGKIKPAQDRPEIMEPCFPNESGEEVFLI